MTEHAPEGQQCNCGLRGWMPGVEHIPPVWQSMIAGFTGVAPGAMKPIVYVDHIMQGWQQTMIRYCQQWNPERRVVTHFTAGRAGRLVQHLSVFDPGVHVGSLQGATWPHAPSAARSANPWSLGCEHEGFSVPLSPADQLSIRAATWGPGNPWPMAMVAASLRAKIYAWQTAPTLQTFGPPSAATLIGHFELDGRNRVNDPAPPAHRHVWPRQRFIDELRQALMPALTADQRELLAWLATPDGQRLSESVRRRLLADTGLSAGAALPPSPSPAPAPAPTPQPQPAQPAMPPTVSAANAAAWTAFWQNGAEPLDYAMLDGVRYARYRVRRRA